MPKKIIRKSAVKNHRQSEEARLRHKARRSELSTLEKNYRAAVAAGDKAAADKLIAQIQSLLDKAAKAGSIHPNKVGRKKSRLASLASAKPASAPASAPSKA